MRSIRPLWLSVLLFFGCEDLPSNLAHLLPCDCSEPTVPSADEWAGEPYCVVEIYDADMNLIQYAEDAVIDSSTVDIWCTRGTEIFWDGYDKDGNAAPPGRYVAKATLSLPCRSKVGCMELLLTPQSRGLILVF